MIALLSINPQHVQNILSGAKTYEFRRRIFARTDVRKVLIYCTKPVSKLVGEFDVDLILEDSPHRLWRKTAAGSGISKAFFDEYFKDRKQAFALQIGRVQKFKVWVSPQEIFSKFTPPQSFKYLKDGELQALKNLKRRAER